MRIADVAWATDVGVRRRRYALANDVRYDGAELNGREPWAHTIVSAGAELVVARHTGEPWNAYVGDPRYEPADVGTSIEVRWADGLEGRTSLIVRPDRYKPRSTYYLVHGPTLDELVVVGWLPGTIVARDKWRRAPNGRAWAWFVPPRALWPAWLPDYGLVGPQLALFDERGTA
jgi:hypothetical protein